jgi:hypothetical protein
MNFHGLLQGQLYFYFTLSISIVATRTVLVDDCKPQKAYATLPTYIPHTVDSDIPTIHHIFTVAMTTLMSFKSKSMLYYYRQSAD